MEHKFKPGQLVVFQFAWDAQTKFRLFPIEDETFVLGMYIKLITYGSTYHDHAVILYKDKLVHAYPYHVREYNP